MQLLRGSSDPTRVDGGSFSLSGVCPLYYRLVWNFTGHFLRHPSESVCAVPGRCPQDAPELQDTSRRVDSHYPWKTIATTPHATFKGGKSAKAGKYFKSVLCP